MSVNTQLLSALIEQNILWVTAGLTAVCLILLIMCITLFVRMRKGRKKLLSKDMNADALIEALEGIDDRIDALHHYAKSINDAAEANAEKLKTGLCRVGIERYDAFPDCGGKQSYSVALLNEKNNGLLIRGIFTRDSHRSYINVITDGKAEIELSEEDKAAIEKAE